jgi:hypothetical protein
MLSEHKFEGQSFSATACTAFLFDSLTRDLRSLFASTRQRVAAEANILIVNVAKKRRESKPRCSGLIGVNRPPTTEVLTSSYESTSRAGLQDLEPRL